MESIGPTSNDPYSWTTQEALWYRSSELSQWRDSRADTEAQKTGADGRRAIAQLLEQLLEKHPKEQVYVAWDNADTHSGGKIEEAMRAAAGRLNLLYLPTYSPWLNPIEMLWRHFRREVTHCELFGSVKELLEASHQFFEKYNNMPDKMLSIIGAHPP